MSGATLKSAQEVFDQAIALESSKKYSEILPLLKTNFPRPTYSVLDAIAKQVQPVKLKRIWN
jgi:hypothetical protein